MGPVCLDDMNTEYGKPFEWLAETNDGSIGGRTVTACCCGYKIGTPAEPPNRNALYLSGLIAKQEGAYFNAGRR